MIRAPILSSLSRIVGPEHLLTRQHDIAEYASDATKLKYMPDAVAFPGKAEEISEILVLANREYFPVIPRGAGTGTSGGALPVNGGLVLCMDRFDRILQIDRDNLIAKVETGVITAHLQEEVERRGLFYPPDPASIKISTIGGNVAECAGGLRAVKYGVTRDYVLGLRVVLPTGEIIRTGVETAKGVVGYDLTRLIVGSEGTLAVITSVTLRLVPKPEFKKTMLAFFPNASVAVQAVSHIIGNRIVPTTLEFMDRLCIECARDELDFPIPTRAQALLLIEVDGDGMLVKKEADKIRELCHSSGAVAFQSGTHMEEAERLWEVRRNVSKALFKLRPDKVSQDVVVPRTRMAEVVSFLDDLGQKYHLPIPAFGHAGDGNIHVNFMLNKTKEEEVQRCGRAVKALFERVLEMGGTLSGEHGVGITKAPYLKMEITKPAFDLMTRVKRAFDPNGILNPGKIFDLPTGLKTGG